MAALFEEGFFVRVPAWHKLGVVLADYPGRAEAFVLAGHDFNMIETPNGNLGRQLNPQALTGNYASVLNDDGLREYYSLDVRAEKKGLYVKQLRDGVPGPLHGNFIETVNAGYEVFENAEAWDILEMVLEEGSDMGLRYETGITLDGGAHCAVTCYVDDPWTLAGDDSPVYPFVSLDWRHDGLGSVRLSNTSIRVVCANTVAAAASEAEKSGRQFVFRHTKNIRDKIADARMAIQGISTAHSEFHALAEELGALTFTERQVEEFVRTMCPDVPAMLTSERVQRNIETAREQVRGALASETVPAAHRQTGWGLYNAGVEFLDHLRKYKTDDSYVRRTLLQPDPYKAKLIPVIRELAEAA